MKPFRYEDLTPSKVRRAAISGGTVSDSNGETIYKDDAFESRPFPSNDERTQHGLDLLEKWQREAERGLGREPTVNPDTQARNEYREIVAALRQFIFAKKITPEEVVWCLKNPVEGKKFLDTEVRHRMPGTTTVADPLFTGFREYQPADAVDERRMCQALDRAMLGPGKTTRVTHNVNGTKSVEMIDVPTAKGPWYRDAAGQFVMNNVRPSEAAAASARFVNAVKRSRGGR